jgi:hypothetical protein
MKSQKLLQDCFDFKLPSAFTLQWRVWLRTGQPGFDPRQSQKVFSSLCVQTGSGAHPASCTMGTGGLFPRGKARPGRDADQCRGLEWVRAISPLPPGAFMACSGTALLPFFIRNCKFDVLVIATNIRFKLSWFESCEIKLFYFVYNNTQHTSFKKFDLIVCRYLDSWCSTTTIFCWLG